MEKKTYKAVCLPAFKANLEIREFEIRKPEKNEVRVKVMATSIMPADLALLQGTYGSSLPQTPFIPGLEGSGVVEEVGEEVDSSIIGKHVSIVANSSSKNYSGIWSQYAYTTTDYLIVFDKKIEFEKIFNAQANPLTAMGFLDTVKKHGKTSVAQNGASSAFGRMFMRLCLKENIDIVNIVRKEQTVKELTENGGKHFVNTSENGWEQKLKQKCNELDITVLFDCCGGKTTGKCLTALKPYGTLYHFGNLELSRLSEIEPKDFIWDHKQMEGWWMNKWLENIPREEVMKAKDYIKNDFENCGAQIFGTTFSESFSLEDYEKAFGCYMMGGKKIIMKPWNNE